MARRISSEPVSRTGEDRLVSLLTRGLPQSARTLTGPGDDCAVLRGPDKSWLTLFKTDCLIQDVHFTGDTDAASVGWKALCRVISDIAAMGGQPQEALITIALPRGILTSWVQRLYTGIKKAARRWGCGIAGGETSSVPDGAPVMISVAMLGRVESKCLTRRSGGKAGDLICVTGRLGGSRAGRHLDFIPRLAEARWLVRHARPSAMMDLSDGLAKDLPRLADASGKGFALDRDAVPLHRGCSPAQGLGDGEDYELLFTLSPRRFARLKENWPFPRVPVTAIGTLLSSTRNRHPLTGGWEHFV
ncbi:MAG TPA: thiamine-phosphate kinase [Verrucomicrobiales bacterium]|nr:thiamine-phosphate kinase [Verrucomicrobiales bacterium]